MSRTYKSQKRRKDRRLKNDPGADSRAIDRALQKENGTLIISRGIHAVHTSRKDKRRSRPIYGKKNPRRRNEYNDSRRRLWTNKRYNR